MKLLKEPHQNIQEGHHIIPEILHELEE